MLSLTFARTAAVAAVCAVLITLCTLAAAIPADARTHAPSGSARCMEDRPCWNWALHGNHRRGVVTTDGARVVVSVCRFARMHRAGRIDYARSGRMRGDTTALHYARCPSQNY